MNKLLELNNIYYTVNKRTTPLGKESVHLILKDISLEIYDGEILGIVGESGCGKTTLAKIIADIIQPSSGVITKYFNFNTNNGANPMQLLFQNSDELINPFRKVKSMLNEIDKVQDNAGILTEVGLSTELIDKLGFQLSGGERQRVGLARILLAHPRVLILDEPFAAQDISSKEKFLQLLTKLKTQLGMTIICISHEIDLLNRLADRIAVMFNGKIIEISPTQNLLHLPMHPYSKYLISASNYELNRNKIITNENSSAACSYFARCEVKKDICLSEVNLFENKETKVYCNNP